jgi:hypothetical protein
MLFVLFGCGGYCFGKLRGFAYGRALVWVQLHLQHAYTLSTQLLISADEGCRMRLFRLNAFGYELRHLNDFIFYSQRGLAMAFMMICMTLLIIPIFDDLFLPSASERAIWICFSFS